ncbi:MAG: hypothetical protein ACRBB3_10680 [Alphaproteobacteria bacterium]
MPHTDRIEKNYFLKKGNARASVWSLWLTPKGEGANNIYFSQTGYLGEDSNQHGFIFHLSLHKNGNAHRKKHNEKKYEFNFPSEGNFPICSVLTHENHITLPINLHPRAKNNNTPIESKQEWEETVSEWIELFFVHIADNNFDDFLALYGSLERPFQILDSFDIQQGRKIYLFVRTVDEPQVQNVEHHQYDCSDHSQLERASVWTHAANNSAHIIIHDFPADQPLPK